MSAMIIFQKTHINYIIDEIQVKHPMSHTTNDYLGATASNTNFISNSGRIISFQSICKRDETSANKNKWRINVYRKLAEDYQKKAGALTSPSKSHLNGNYILTSFDYVEDTSNNYLINWEFTEVKKFNVTSKTFRVWGKTATKSTTKKTTTNKKAGVNLPSNLKKLLKDCGVMQKQTKRTNCIKCLQIWLQSQGYYKKYKLDGWFDIYTEQAVKQVQKKYKLKVTGKWDKNTRSYFQKKYKYP